MFTLTTSSQKTYSICIFVFVCIKLNYGAKFFFKNILKSLNQILQNVRKISVKCSMSADNSSRKNDRIAIKTESPEKNIAIEVQHETPGITINQYSTTMI